jgi:hypothetical protein
MAPSAVHCASPLAPAGTRLRDAAHRPRADGPVVDDHAHEPQAGPSASVNRPGAGSAAQPRSARRSTFDRIPSTPAGHGSARTVVSDSIEGWYKGLVQKGWCNLHRLHRGHLSPADYETVHAARPPHPWCPSPHNKPSGAVDTQDTAQQCDAEAAGTALGDLLRVDETAGIAYFIDSMAKKAAAFQDLDGLHPLTVLPSQPGDFVLLGQRTCRPLASGPWEGRLLEPGMIQ